MTKIERCVKLALFFHEHPQQKVTSAALAQRYGVPKYAVLRDLRTLSRTGIVPLIYRGGKWYALER